MAKKRRNGEGTVIAIDVRRSQIDHILATFAGFTVRRMMSDEMDAYAKLQLDRTYYIEEDKVVLFSTSKAAGTSIRARALELASPIVCIKETKTIAH